MSLELEVELRYLKEMIYDHNHMLHDSSKQPRDRDTKDSLDI